MYIDLLYSDQYWSASRFHITLKSIRAIDELKPKFMINKVVVS